ncbi:hypothetical protein K402DRAFT_411626 [Aulographum hederae CBS 113979]|uniref:Integral membrane protein n=1 Tax=Aulographum hederae CBS 113979 TaxID=1176131 RepID=A0A6G1H5B1_9PEZI|nr:hypothetical protein K402DRAFT_411626 [Aulographum hederae CBS 113979]
MQNRRLLLLAASAVLLGLARAHGDEAGKMEMGGMGDHAADAPKIDAGPPSYFRHTEHAGLMYAHIAIMTLGWTVVLPIGVVFSVARSRYTLPAQLVFLLFNAFGLLCSIVYNQKVPNLYENNAHHKSGWTFILISAAWVLMGLVNLYTGREKSLFKGHPVSIDGLARYQRLQEAQSPTTERRWSGDSGQGTERNSGSLLSHSRSPSVESENQQLGEAMPAYAGEPEEEDVEDVEKRGFLRHTRVDRFLSRNVRRFAFGRTVQVVRIVYAVLDRFMLILGFVAITTGAPVYGGVFRGNAVFSGLAHFIKGGIFFWYGLLTFGRWMGSFADLGWAWNRKPTEAIVGRWKARMPSAEFTESFLLALYGASNVFLEHLAAWGEEWSAQDLEHVSITLMFFGGGVLGMLIESKSIRSFLSTNIILAKDQDPAAKDKDWEEPEQYRFPMNPVPGLVIMLLGIMMSSHHQLSMVSTMLHSQWGTMFVGCALARGVTYLTLYLSPPSSYLPSRPPSEIIASFCLVGGGLIFMMSNTDTVESLEYNNLDAMFVFTVTMGVACLLLAWTTIVLALKGWAVRREQRSGMPVSATPTFLQQA